jgi:hypothetical protein
LTAHQNLLSRSLFGLRMIAVVHSLPGGAKPPAQATHVRILTIEQIAKHCFI